MDQIAAMRSFVAAVDERGFSAAGRRLGLTGPMVGNHIRFLERELGGMLLHRTTRSQRLTELGNAYLLRCRRVLAELDGADADAAELLGRARGRLRMTAPHSLGSTALPPILAGFLNDHPEIEIDLYLDDHRANLLSGRHDLALRVGDLADAALVTRALIPMQLLCCASPSYLAHSGRPTKPTDLSSHACLDFLLSPKTGAWRFDAPEGALDVPISGRLKSDGALALRGMALSGAGIALLPTALVKNDVDAGRLVPLLDGWTPVSRPVQLLTLPGRPSAKLRLLIDALVSGFGASMASSAIPGS